MNIYVGNLSFDTTEDQLRQAFESHGEVSTVNIITDKYSGKPKGFGFVEMSAKDEAVTAIGELNGFELNGRPMNVNEAKPRPQGGNRGGNGYRKSY
jgi:RNA recognition motif-containing protein